MECTLGVAGELEYRNGSSPHTQLQFSTGLIRKIKFSKIEFIDVGQPEKSDNSLLCMHGLFTLSYLFDKT